MDSSKKVRSFLRLAARCAGAAAAVLFAVSCEHNPVDVGVVASITVSRNPDTLTVAAIRQFTAIGRDANGSVVAINPVWSVAASGGTISSTGVFTAGTAIGTFANTITAAVGSIAGRATVTVLAGIPPVGALATMVVTPNPAILAAGGTQQFAVTGKDINGNVVAVTPTWTVAAGGGTIASTGLFTAGTQSGTFANTIKACSVAGCASGLSAFATITVGAGGLANITVTPNPVNVGVSASQQFTAVGTDASGNITPILPAPTWSVTAGGAGGTILSNGLYTAPAAAGSGVDNVKATSGALSGSAVVNVKASGALAAISVTPNPASVIAGSTTQFTATGFDASGLVVATPGLSWSVVANGGTIASTGMFTAGAATGTFPNTIRAASGTVFGFATVNVTPALVTGVSLGAAATHGILAGTAVTCAGAPGSIGADVSVWPGSAISGFPPCTISGARHAADAFAQTAQGDLTSAYLALAAMPCGTTITADLGGTTLTPGVYCATSSVGVTGTVTLNGPAGSVFVIRAPTSLTTAGSVVMTGGASAADVYWWTGSSATLGSGSAWQGNILSLTSISLIDGVTLSGRALARNGAVTLGVGSHISLP